MGGTLKLALFLVSSSSLQLILEGVAKAVDEPGRAYRGFVAVDDINLQPLAEGNADACFGESGLTLTYT